jgi:hypothetical protein
VSKPETTPLEIRYDDGKLDEIVATGCDLHLEQLSGNMWWMSVTAGGRTVHVNLSAKSQVIRASVINAG